jgi:tetratricopeptide (TPR) repeat protein
MTKSRRSALHEAAASLSERDGDPVEVLAHHLETAASLRADLGAPDEHDVELSARAAAALAASGEDALARGDRQGAVAVLPRAVGLARVAGGAQIDVGRLAFRLGAWNDVVEMFEPIRDDPAAWNPLGVALGKTGELDRARALLERAASAGDVDAAAALAGTWKGVDDERAYAGYLSALELDPTDPYALGNVLDIEIERSHDLSPVADRLPSVASARERRRHQALEGIDQPWSWFDLGKFELLLGRDDECLDAFAAAALTTSAAFMLETTARSLERLDTASGSLHGYEEALSLLGLARRALFEPVEGSGRAWILVGASGASAAGRIDRYRGPLLAAFEGASGPLISGGTAQGVSALAADVSDAVKGIRSIGYLPSKLPDDVVADERYDELLRTSGESFGAREPLAYWSDLLDVRLSPADVRIVAIGGGSLTGFEIRLALALGAVVGVIAEAGGAGAALLADPTWAMSGRLVALDPTESAFRAFLVAV